MHQTCHCGIQFLCSTLFHQCIILWMFRRTWNQPHRLMPQVMESMESRSCCDLKFESNSCFHRNLPSYPIVDIVLMWLIRNPETLWTVWELAVTWWFCSWFWGIIWDMVFVQSLFRFVNTGVQILIGEIDIFGVEQVNEFKIVSIYHFINNNCDNLCHSRHYGHQGYFMGWSECRKHQWWSCQDVWTSAGHCIQSLQWIPLAFFTDNPGIVVLSHFHPLFLWIRPENPQQCVGNIGFSPPPPPPPPPPTPHSLTEDWAMEHVQRYCDPGDALGNGFIRTSSGIMDGLSDWEYIFWRPWG